MNDRVLQIFQNQDTAREYLESRRWPNGTACPRCKNTDKIHKRRQGDFYRCNNCLLDFTVRTATIFERSHVPLHKWLYAMYLLPKGISSVRLSAELGITQQSAWFMLQRLRAACGKKLEKLRGVEIDEVLDRIVDVVLKHKPKKRKRTRMHADICRLFEEKAEIEACVEELIAIRDQARAVHATGCGTYNDKRTSVDRKKLSDLGLMVKESYKTIPSEFNGSGEGRKGK